MAGAQRIYILDEITALGFESCITASTDGKMVFRRARGLARELAKKAAKAQKELDERIAKLESDPQRNMLVEVERPGFIKEGGRVRALSSYEIVVYDAKSGEFLDRIKVTPKIRTSFSFKR